MRRLILGLMAACLMSTSALAQDADHERRLTLADQYLALSFGADFQRAMEEQLKTLYGKSDIAPDQRAWLTSHLMSAIQSIMPQVSTDIRDETADLYTAEELEAMIAFQSTPVGRSANAKGVRMSEIISEAMQRPMVEALSGLMQKYCAAFDCPAGTLDPAKAR